MPTSVALVEPITRLRGAARLFLQLLDRFVADARLAFVIEGRTYLVGARSETGAEADVTVVVHRPRVFRRVLAAGNLGLGEAYMGLDFEVEAGALEDFLTILARNRLDERIKTAPSMAARILLTRLVDNVRGKTHNVQRHYDLGVDLFEAFLDSTLTYSCGYVHHTDDSLEQLQFNKLDRICRKLRLREGDHLLDIGCGYGGLLRHAARHYGVTGVGVTISQHHTDHGNALIRQDGLQEQVEIRFADYTTVEGRFDKVVSVGMLEHVPRREYRRYFRKIADVLAPDGLGLVHAIGANAPTNRHDPFFQKYIFPNSNQPRLSEIAEHLEHQALPILDVENMVRHYGYTVRRWLEHFQAHRDRLDPARYDAVFQRMWEYYLCCGIAAAFATDSALYQVLFARDYAGDFPLHRV